MKILFFHSNTPDYLSAGLFHGLREVLGNKCLDIPRFDCMYAPLSDEVRSKIRGNGFSLYGLLEDYPENIHERFFIWHKNISDFDYYIVADIWNSWEVYLKLIRSVPKEKIIIIDPSDNFRFYPFNNFYKNGIFIFFQYLFSDTKSIKYFKRELSSSLKDRTGLYFLPNFIQRILLPKNVYKINFSIPSSKISRVTPNNKIKDFTANIVDEELVSHFPELQVIPIGQELYKFNKEREYYADIQNSRFGITTKRSGWDCLRHYEYAANGAVLCFKNYQEKPVDCAPHGLDKSNCIFYKSTEDLKLQVAELSDEEYSYLLENSYKWISNNTTKKIAEKFLNDIIK
ncbi:MAG: hypothetical protein IKD55_06260 [Sediminibacterium sp.]|nr:hypothetical protein [Sediminibacterium sp.]